jgi:hypothetical protein
MVQFYVTADTDARRCRDAMQNQEIVTVTGALEGQLMVFTGKVRSVQDDHCLGLVAWLVSMDCIEIKPIVSDWRRSGSGPPSKR